MNNDTWTIKRTLTRHQVAELEDRVAAANRKAKRAGAMPFEVEVGEYYPRQTWVAITPHSGDWVAVHKAAVTVTGYIPRIKGDWKLIAVADQEHATGVVTWSRTTDSVDVQALPANTHCDHCNAHRNRRKVFYLGASHGRVMRLGSSCVKEYLKDVTAQQLMFEAYAAGLRAEMCTMEEGFAALPKGFTLYDPAEVLALAYTLTAETGYVSRARSEDTGLAATASKVFAALEDPTYRRSLKNTGFDGPDGTWIDGDWDNMVAKANTTLEWVRSLDDSQDNEFMLNLVAVAKADKVASKHTGILCAALACHARHLKDEATKAVKVKDAWVGTVGERLVLDVNVTAIRVSDGYYGQTIIYNFHTTDGEPVVWFCSGAGLGVDEGDTIRIKGTIKEHGEFRGQRQTKLNRVVAA